MLEYQLDQIKIVDFLLIAKFWARALFFETPSIFFWDKNSNKPNQCAVLTVYRPTAHIPFVKDRLDTMVYKVFFDLRRHDTIVKRTLN